MSLRVLPMCGVLRDFARETNVITSIAEDIEVLRVAANERIAL